MFYPACSRRKWLWVRRKAQRQQVTARQRRPLSFRPLVNQFWAYWERQQGTHRAAIKNAAWICPGIWVFITSPRHGQSAVLAATVSQSCVSCEFCTVPSSLVKCADASQRAHHQYSCSLAVTCSVLLQQLMAVP
jgi:hypothetical protein